MKNVFLFLTILTLFACTKEEEIVFPQFEEFKQAEDVYRGTITTTKIRSPYHPCGVNGCGPVFSNDLPRFYRLSLTDDTYNDGLLSGEYTRTEEQIIFKSGEFNCPSSIDCIALLPLDKWIDYEINGDTLSFAYTDSLVINDGYMDRLDFSLVNEN